MVNFLHLALNPLVKYERYFEILRDFRKGGLSPTNYAFVIAEINAIPKDDSHKAAKLQGIASKHGLSNITEQDFEAIMRELKKRSTATAKQCWHPDASMANCRVDGGGHIVISAAHSIQNNGILSRISKDGHVKGFVMESGSFDGKLVGKNFASTFYGFCNKHDAVFRPIETEPYTGSAEQKFLFAYRGFVVAMHAKEETSYFMDYGEQSQSDIANNKALFDSIIATSAYGDIITQEYRLNAFYPIAAASSFYLESDFEGSVISHSDKRMEYIYVTLFPLKKETVFLLSYFKQDDHLYAGLTKQITKRDKLKSDISILLCPNVENIFFEPVYFDTFIERQADAMHKAFRQSQLQFVGLDKNNKIISEESLTPKNFLQNEFLLSLFGY